MGFWVLLKVKLVINKTLKVHKGTLPCLERLIKIHYTKYLQSWSTVYLVTNKGFSLSIISSLVIIYKKFHQFFKPA